MLSMKITGTGRYLPGRPYTNHDLARVMDTSDEWITQRTGIKQRHYCQPHQGPAEIALPAAEQALKAAGLSAKDLDYILFNTMTPDHVWPGSGPLLGSRLGCAGVPALDIRVQCAAFIFSLQLADALIKSHAAQRILVVGAEAHAGFMPWRDWDILRGESERKPDRDAWALATRHRGWSIIFGDGAGALVVQAQENGGADSGLLGVDIRTDGNYVDQLLIPAGFGEHPYISEQVIEKEQLYPHMDGREVFKHAVTKLPRSIKTACDRAGLALTDIDWFVAHQANARINDAVVAKLRLPVDKVPSNIERYGNTSAATIPILLDEMAEDGRLRPGQNLCMFALGAGLHWGSLVFRT